MRITVNGEPREVPPGTTVGDLLADLALDKAICAAELNRRVLPRAQRDAHPLHEGDTLELVTLVGGG